MKTQLNLAALAVLLLISCNDDPPSPDPGPVTDHYTATARYVYILQNNITTDTSYSTTFHTSELNDTMTVSYAWRDGRVVTEKMTSKKTYGTDSVVYGSFHIAPQYILTLYPGTHHFAYKRIFDSRSAGDNFWDYYLINGS